MPRDTRAKILDAAESSFADNGFAATSLRDITTEAGVNVAAVNYHFGSKDALLAAVVERRIAPVNQQRLELLERAEASAGGAPVELEELLRALLAPPFRQRREWDDQETNFLQLVGRLYSMPHAQVRAILTDQFREVMERFMPAFRRALPELEEHEVGWRVFFIIGAMVNTMTWSELIHMFGGRRAHDSDEVLEALIRFAAAGIRAAVPVKVTL